MNKYLKTSLCYFIGSSLLYSCDVMDTKPFEVYSEEDVWGSVEMVDGFVMETYNSTISKFAGDSPNWESMTPNGAQCDQVYPSINTIATETGLSSSTDYGFGRFGEQRRCNMIIEKVATSTTLTEDQKIELIAEGHFLRGMLYFDMTRKMGRFVPITRVLTVEDTDEFSTPLTASVEESYKLVMADLDIACKDLPLTSASGRANRYAALALRSRVALQAYAYTKDKAYLEVVINSANAVVNSNAYTLTADYGSMFDKRSPNDPEIILAKYWLIKDATIVGFPETQYAFPNLPFDDVVNGSADGVFTLNPKVTMLECWAQYWPTQDLVDQYLVIDDENPSEAKVWYETSQYKKSMDPINTTGLAPGGIEKFQRFDGEFRNLPTIDDFNSGRTDYPLFKQAARVKPGIEKTVTEIIYGNRDKRMDATIIRDKSILSGYEMETNLGGNASQGIRAKEDGGWYNTTTGYYWRKSAVEPDPNVNSGVKADMHYVITRLGEVYMNLAEAYLLKGDVSNAVTALNVTRMKHGGLPASKASTLDEAWSDYLRERRVEMAYEAADIYFSYLRWGKYGGPSNHDAAPGSIIKDLKAPVYKIGITSDRKAFCVGMLTILNSWNRDFTTRRYLFPIPKDAMDKRAASGIIDNQNTGY